MPLSLLPGARKWSWSHVQYEYKSNSYTADIAISKIRCTEKGICDYAVLSTSESSQQ